MQPLLERPLFDIILQFPAEVMGEKSLKVERERERGKVEVKPKPGYQCVAYIFNRTIRVLRTEVDWSLFLDNPLHLILVLILAVACWCLIGCRSH